MQQLFFVKQHGGQLGDQLFFQTGHRQRCQLVQRKDDAPETVKVRLDVYHKETEPLKAFYAQRGLLKSVENQATVAETSQVILRALGR